MKIVQKTDGTFQDLILSRNPFLYQIASVAAIAAKWPWQDPARESRASSGQTAYPESPHAQDPCQFPGNLLLFEVPGPDVRLLPPLSQPSTWGCGTTHDLIQKRTDRNIPKPQIQPCAGPIDAKSRVLFLGSRAPRPPSHLLGERTPPARQLLRGRCRPELQGCS